MTEDEMVGWHHQFNGQEFAHILMLFGGMFYTYQLDLLVAVVEFL